jgi:hypothetical protein
VNINEIIAALLITGWIALFALQVYGLITPKKAAFMVPAALAVVTGAAVTLAVWTLYPSLPALLMAAVAGVYGNWGSLFVAGMVILETIMGVIAWWSWTQNRLIDMTH